MAVTGGARDGSGGRTPPSRGAMGGGAEEKKRRRRWERERGNAEQGRQGRSVRVHPPECHYQSSTSNQHSCATAAHGGGALLRTTSARTCGWGGRTGTGGRGRRLLHSGLSGLPGLPPGKPGVSGTTSDAPEEATQRPPFLALRGPSHSHPGALLHR